MNFLEKSTQGSKRTPVKWKMQVEIGQKLGIKTLHDLNESNFQKNNLTIR